MPRLRFPAAGLSVAALILLLVLAGCSAVTPLTGSPAAPLEPPPALLRASGAASAQAANYCVACHSGDDPRLAAPLAWAGGSQALAVSPCPAAVQMRQEVYYTERMLLSLDRAYAGVPGGAARDRLAAQAAAGRQTYSRLLDAPVTSLDAFTSEAQTLRYRLGKIYAGYNQLDTAARRDRVLLGAGLITLALLVSLAWGWRNTLKLSPARALGLPSLPRAGALRSVLSGRWRPALLAMLTVVLFSLPFLRTVPGAVDTPSAADQARQTTLNLSGRKADVAERALERAAMLGRIGAAWAGVDAVQGETTLDAALLAAAARGADNAALWGEGQAAQEAALGSPAAQESARMVDEKLQAERGRAWALRLIGEAWAPVDAQRARDIFQRALAVASATGPTDRPAEIYRALDLRALAVAWARLDRGQGLQVAALVDDPALRSWALREIASASGDRSLLAQAAAAARLVADPVQRARSLGEVASASGEPALFAEALAALDGVTGSAGAYALAGLAAGGHSATLEKISPAHPDARALALYRLGQFEAAAAASALIADPFERAQAQSAIAVAWGNASFARQIADPTLRDRARRDVAIKTKDAGLAQDIGSTYYRVQALTTLGESQAAADAAATAGDVKDTLPLRELALDLARVGQAPAALALVERLDRQSDKSLVLAALAARGDPATFERALGLALAARVPGDPLAPAEASLKLWQSVKAGGSGMDATRALVQALDVAQKIVVKYK